jgi:hypothetical protein
MEGTTAARLELVPFFASRLIDKKNYHLPCNSSSFFKVRQIFEKIFPEPSLVRTWSYDPKENRFHIELLKPHRKGNQWMTFQYEQLIQGVLQRTDEPNKYQMIFEKGVKATFLGIEKPISSLQHKEGLFHICYPGFWSKEGWIKKPVDVLLNLARDFVHLKS